MIKIIETNYSRVDTSKFYDGMHLNSEIYYLLDNKYILAFKDDVITSSILEKLRALESIYDGLYIKAGESEQFFDSVAVQADLRKFNELRKKHENIAVDISEMFSKITSQGSLDSHLSNKISSDIITKLCSADTSTAIQIVNSLRDANKYLYTHSENVAFLNGLMGRWLGLPEKKIEKLVKIGFLHDVGKVKIPDNIINKPGPLSSGEFEIMKAHSVFSYEIIKDSGENDPEVLTAIRGHHEKINGTGYPDKLSSTQLSLFTKITTISDIYDAMVAQRVYKAAHSPFEVLDEFSKDRFSNLDTHLINIFLINMTRELSGKSVKLSDGRTGKVVYINSNNYAYPVVSIDGEITETNDALKCLYVFG